MPDPRLGASRPGPPRLSARRPTPWRIGAKRARSHAGRRPNATELGFVGSLSCTPEVRARPGSASRFS
jgi:hypothetical protein